MNGWYRQQSMPVRVGGVTTAIETWPRPVPSNHHWQQCDQVKDSANRIGSKKVRRQHDSHPTTMNAELRPSCQQPEKFRCAVLPWPMGKKRRRLVNQVFTSEATQTTTLVLGLFPTMESKRRGNSLQTRNSTPDGVPLSRPRTRDEPSTFQCGWQEQSKSLGTCQEHHPVLNQKWTKTQLKTLECRAMKFVIRALVFHIWASDTSLKLFFQTHGEKICT